MKPTVLLSLLLSCYAGHAQQVFFRSAQQFDSSRLKNFYSSIALQDSLLLFNGNDYELYAYNKHTGQLQWQYYLSWKSSQAPFFANSMIWARKGEGEMIQLDRQTGQLKGALPFSTVETQPVIKGNIAYATGLYDGGCLFAYDLKTDMVLWHRFLAHGCSVVPYYLGDRITANAEGNNWLEIGYDGQLIQKGCDSVEVGYPSGSPCIKQFAFLTHDRKEIPETFVDKQFSASPDEISFYSTAHATFLAGNGRLLVLGDKLKEKTSIQLSALSDSLQLYDNEPVKILQADEKLVWLFSMDQLIVYNYQDKKLVKTADLSPWHPYQVVPDGERLWVISRADGLLYGLGW